MWIQKCIESLLLSEIPSRIIVVDNDSKDNTVHLLRSHYSSKIDLIVVGENLGFGQANNIGIKKAINESASHIFLLNQDAFVEPNTLGELLKVMLGNKILGIVSPIHLNGTGKALDYNFYNYFLKSEIGHLVNSILLRGKIDQEFITTKFVNAAAWLISRECLAKVGGFDQLFFHYGEDRNFAHRVIFRGFQIGIVTNSRIFHDRESRSELSARKLSQRIEFDLMNFKIDASNIRRTNIHLFITKRILRYFVLMLLSVLRFKFLDLKYNAKMMYAIIKVYPQIMQSRKRSFKGSLQYY